jgi:F-type H+-transporting ATPase subunit c
MDLQAAKMIGAGLAVFSLIGAGLGLGNLFSNWISAIARNPSVKDDLKGIGYVGAAFIEAVALFALVIAFVIVFKPA